MKHANLFTFFIVNSSTQHTHSIWLLFRFLGTGQASKSGKDVLLDLLSIGSPSAPSSSSTVDILSSNTSNKAPASPLDDLSSLSLSSRETSNAAPMMDLLDSFSPSPPTGCKLCLTSGHYHYLKFSLSTDFSPFSYRKQRTSLSICDCIWEQLLEVDIQFFKATRKPTNNIYPSYLYELVP